MGTLPGARHAVRAVLRDSGARSRGMPRLIYLKSPRVGQVKRGGQVRRRLPGDAPLDIDVLVGLIGGWRDYFFGVLGTARGHGRALAQRHRVAPTRSQIEAEPTLDADWRDSVSSARRSTSAGETP